MFNAVVLRLISLSPKGSTIFELHWCKWRHLEEFFFNLKVFCIKNILFGEFGDYVITLYLNLYNFSIFIRNFKISIQLFAA